LGRQNLRLCKGNRSWSVPVHDAYVVVFTIVYVALQPHSSTVEAPLRLNFFIQQLRHPLHQKTSEALCQPQLLSSTVEASDRCKSATSLSYFLGHGGLRIGFLSSILPGHLVQQLTSLLTFSASLVLV
jgi:hypothetical protein